MNWWEGLGRAFFGMSAAYFVLYMGWVPVNQVGFQAAAMLISGLFCMVLATIQETGK